MHFRWKRWFANLPQISTKALHCPLHTTGKLVSTVLHSLSRKSLERGCTTGPWSEVVGEIKVWNSKVVSSICCPPSVNFLVFVRMVGHVTASIFCTLFGFVLKVKLFATEGLINNSWKLPALCHLDKGTCTINKSLQKQVKHERCEHCRESTYLLWACHETTDSIISVVPDSWFPKMDGFSVRTIKQISNQNQLAGTEFKAY